MKHTRLMLLVTLCSCLTQAQDERREIIGYYPSWKLHTDAHLMTPEKIPFDKLTIINYAFFTPLASGVIVGRDSLGDDTILGAPYGGTSGRPSLTDLAHRHGVKVMLSIGGWEDSNNFPAVASDPVTRKRFASSCQDRVGQFGFDGIDIDWEFPGYVDHNGSPADRRNFTLLLQAIRDSLDALGRERGRHFLLSAALPSDEGRAAAMEVGTIAEILDFLNIMTYDIYGPWDSLAYHNAPLYASDGRDRSRSLDGAFLLYHRTYGIPASKINLGVPFYGHTYRHCTALNSPHEGRDTAHFPPSGAFYWAIAEQMDNFHRYWDDSAQVPYLVSSAWNMLVSYDDEESVRIKARYAVEHGLRGLIIWEITGDYLSDGSNPLLEALSRVFQDAPQRGK